MNSRPVLAALLAAAAALAQAQPPAVAPPAGPAAGPPSDAAGGCVTVEVRNVRPRTGHVMVAAYTDAAAFPRQPAASARIAAAEAVAVVRLCGLGGDAVAVSTFQDLDSDGKLKTNLFGLPTEPWAVSGKPAATGPRWDTARVPLDGTPVVVTLSD